MSQEFRDTPWDRDVRATMVAIIRQTPIAQVGNLMPYAFTAAVEIADKLAALRQSRAKPPLKMPEIPKL